MADTQTSTGPKNNGGMTPRKATPRNQHITGKVTAATRTALIGEAAALGISIAQHVSNILENHCAAKLTPKS